MKKIVYLFFLIVIVTISCNKSTDPVTPMQSSEIVPLKNTIFWQFSVYKYDASGNINYASITYRMIISQGSSGSNTVYKIKDSSDYDCSKTYFNCYNSTGGFYSTSSDKDNSYQLKYKYPGNIGDTYNYKGFKMTLTAIDVLLTVSSGSFKCNQYSGYNSQTGESFVYFVSPGTGEIKIEYIKNGTLSTVWELMKYK